jgi:hypothetical protein
MEQVIAPGVSYSPEMAGGYTQKDLDMIAAGPAPVMPIAPTTGDVATIDDQMSYAPVGTTEPTRFSIGDTLFPNVDYLQGLDFSGLPGLGNVDMDAIIKEYQDRQDAGEPEPFESFLTEFSQAPVMPDAPVYQAPAPVVPFEDKNVFELRQETESMVNPYNQLQGDYAKGLFDIPGVPQAPVMPSFPIQQPMNFTGLPPAPAPVYTPPPSYTQPRVEEIVSPIRGGSTRQLPQPGLFNLV